MYTFMHAFVCVVVKSIRMRGVRCPQYSHLWPSRFFLRIFLKCSHLISISNILEEFVRNLVRRNCEKTVFPKVICDRTEFRVSHNFHGLIIIYWQEISVIPQMMKLDPALTGMTWGARQMMHQTSWVLIILIGLRRLIFTLKLHFVPPQLGVDCSFMTIGIICRCAANLIEASLSGRMACGTVSAEWFVVRLR